MNRAENGIPVPDSSPEAKASRTKSFKNLIENRLKIHNCQKLASEAYKTHGYSEKGMDQTSLTKAIYDNKSTHIPEVQQAKTTSAELIPLTDDAINSYIESSLKMVKLSTRLKNKSNGKDFLFINEKEELDKDIRRFQKASVYSVAINEVIQFTRDHMLSDLTNELSLASEHHFKSELVDAVDVSALPVENGVDIDVSKSPFVTFRTI